MSAGIRESWSRALHAPKHNQTLLTLTRWSIGGGTIDVHGVLQAEVGGSRLCVPLEPPQATKALELAATPRLWSTLTPNERLVQFSKSSLVALLPQPQDLW